MIENEKNNDNDITLSFFKEEVKKFIEERNWVTYHTPKNLVQAINCEAGELSQLLLFKDYTKEEIKENENLFNNISDEIADVFIYLISLINSLDLDLTNIFMNKMKKNKKKYSKKEFNDGKYYKKSN
ncbi:MAG: MazG-like family protein [Candidatus Lokiarchaeia archaeon]|nr:MazG-like family protein [Candidatus Lokiarchaeia archaeon]